MVQFLLKQRDDEELYDKHFKQRAARWLDGTEQPLHRVSRHALKTIVHTSARDLASSVMSDMKQSAKGNDIGGGITETLQSLSRATWNFMGGPEVMRWFGHKEYEKKQVPKQMQAFAAAVDETYLKMEDRPLHVYGLERLPEYDSDRCSVWRQRNGELFVSVHGTRFTKSDLQMDAQILGGDEEIHSDEVENLIRTLLEKGFRVDCGGHSLGTALLTNLPEELQQKVDEFYLFNPASSPLMSNEYLDDIVSRPNYTYFVNPSDLVSSGAYNRMDEETIRDHVYLNDFRWSPLAAHDPLQWTEDLDEEDKELWTPDENEQFRAHLMGEAKMRAHAEETEHE